jgi:hypothetical protein
MSIGFHRIRRKDCGHEVTMWPPLKDRPGVVLEMIPCGQCIRESNEKFYTELRRRADAERCRPGANALVDGNPWFRDAMVLKGKGE